MEPAELRPDREQRRYQDAKFQELAVTTSGPCSRPAKKWKTDWSRSCDRSGKRKLLDESVTAADKAVKIVVLQYEKGAVDFNRYAVIEQIWSHSRICSRARGQIAQGLVATYRAFGGGWEIRLTGEGIAAPMPGPLPDAVNPPEQVPQPQPAAANPPVLPPPEQPQAGELPPPDAKP